RFKRQTYTVMLQDIYPEGLSAVRRLRAGGLISRIWRGANRAAFLQAHEVWVLGRDMKALVHENYRIPATKIRYVPHWSSVAFATNVRPADTRLWQELKL